MKKEKGITLIALVVTIIVLLILAGVGIGTTTGIKGNIKTSKNNVALAELSEVQQAVLETYTKYKITHNSNSLLGTKITYSEANTNLQNIATKASTTLTLKANNYDGLSNVNPEEYYYKLEKEDFEKMGIQNSEDTYIVNYSTGEAFNCTALVTSEGKALYVDVAE